MTEKKLIVQGVVGFNRMNVEPENEQEQETELDTKEALIAALREEELMIKSTISTCDEFKQFVSDFLATVECFIDHAEEAEIRKEDLLELLKLLKKDLDDIVNKCLSEAPEDKYDDWDDPSYSVEEINEKAKRCAEYGWERLKVSNRQGMSLGIRLENRLLLEKMDNMQDDILTALKKNVKPDRLANKDDYDPELQVHKKYISLYKEWMKDLRREI